MRPGHDWSEAEVADALARGAAARTEFDETLRLLRAAITGVDAIEVLARAAVSLILRLAHLEQNPTEKGVEVFHVEILQALALSAPRVADNDHDNYSQIAVSCVDLIERNGQAYRHLWLRKITADAARNHREELIALLQSWTMAIRGPRHPHQTQELLSGLAKGVDQVFRQTFKCSPVHVVAVLNGMIETLERRMQDFRTWMMTWGRKSSGIAMIQSFVATASEESAAFIREQALPHRYVRERVRAYLTHLAEDRYVALFSFDRDDFAQYVPAAELEPVMAIIDSLSMNFGDIGDDVLAHIHLANPVRLKPLIRLGDGRYFCGNPTSLGTNAAEIFQAICDRMPATKKGLEKARAQWLEAKVRTLVGEAFPHADVRQSVKWDDPVAGKNGECDVVAVIDKTVMVLEAKSGRIDEPARRGAFNSLRGALKTLVVEPSEQSRGMQDYLARVEGSVELPTKEEPLTIDASAVRKIIRVNVVLDVVGPLSAHWPQLTDAGLIPEEIDIAPTMSVFELETVLEVLDSEIERCHYLARRVELERDVRYTADELDLLGLYLETQFNVSEPPTDDGLWIYGKSFAVATAYGRYRGGEKPRFPIKRTELWRDLLAGLEAKRPAGWTRFGHRLLNIDYEGQRRFGRLVRDGQQQVARTPDHFFTSAVTAVTGDRKNTVAFVIGPQVETHQFNLNIQHAVISAADQGGVKDLLLIYWFQPATGQPYDFIGVMKHATLPRPDPFQ